MLIKQVGGGFLLMWVWWLVLVVGAAGAEEVVVAVEEEASIGRGLVIVACLLVPVVLIVVVVRVLLGRGKTAVTEGPPASPVRHQPVRMVEDGFWIDGEWAAGTPLVIRYVIGGVEQEQDLIYQPEEDGQFVFTGVTPDAVTVVVPDGDPIPPPVVTAPPIIPETKDEHGPVSPVPPLDPRG